MFPERSAGPILARMMDPPSPAPNAGLLFGAPPSVGCPAVTQRSPAGAIAASAEMGNVGRLRELITSPVSEIRRGKARARTEAVTRTTST